MNAHVKRLTDPGEPDLRPRRRRPQALAGTKPRVSVVIPCYNYGHFLDHSVGSVLAQSGVEVDVLIIDDASPDGSGAVAERLAAKHAAVSALCRVENVGHIANYNDGLLRATGEFVVLLDGDDVIPPGAFRRATDLMRAEPTIGLVYGHPTTFVDAPPPVSDEAARGWSIWTGEQWIRAQCRRGLSIIYSPEVVMRRSIQSVVGRMRPELPHAGDLDLWLRIAAVSDVGRVNGPAQGMRRVHGESMMQTGYGTVLDDIRGRMDAWISFFEHDAHSLRARSDLERLCRRTVAAEALSWVCGQLRQGEQPDIVPEYLAFARHVYRDVDNLAMWREYEWLTRRASEPTLGDRIRLRTYSARSDIHGRLTWQRWYRSGY